MDEEDGGGWMRLDTKCELHITVPYQTWKTLEDCAYNRTVRRCSVSYGTDDTEQSGTGQTNMVTHEVEEDQRQDTIEAAPVVADSKESNESTSEEPEIEFIEVIYV